MSAITQAATVQSIPSQEDIKKFNNLVKGIRFSMMTTKSVDGLNLHSRPMVTQETEWDGKHLWFFTSKNSQKVNEIQRDEHVNVSFSDSSKNVFVSVIGTATPVLNDLKRMKQLWNPFLKTYFAKGVDDPELGLICVTVHGIEYWDSSENAMVKLWHAMKSTMTGEAYQPSHKENKKIDMDTTASLSSSQKA